MSVNVLNWVFANSPATLGSRLVLLALADYAHDDGTEAFPSVATLATKARMSPRAARTALRKLEREGHIEQTGTSPSGTAIYRVVMGAEVSSAPEDSSVGSSRPDPRKNLPPNVLKERLEGEAGKPASPSNEEQPSSSELDRDRPEIDALCRRLAERILANDPKAKVQPDSERWRAACRRLLDIDGRSVDEVERVIDWCQSDSFWQSNVLAMPKLREKFDQLWAKAKKARPAGPEIIAGPSSSAAPCPGAAASDRLRARWDDAVAALRGCVAPDAFEMWLKSLHAHGDDQGALVIGADPGVRAWVADRYADVLATAAGCPVRVVACGGSEAA